MDKKIRKLQESLEIIKEKSSPGGKDLFYKKTDDKESGTELTNSVQKSIRDLEDKKKQLKLGLISSGKQRKKEYLKKQKEKTALEIKEPKESGMSDAASEAETKKFNIPRRASCLKKFHI